MSNLSIAPQFLARPVSSVDPLVASAEREQGESAGGVAGRASGKKVRSDTKARVLSTRRRGDDPTTCDPDYSPEELEFILAIQRYKQESGRMFPTWREVLEVLRSLGYERTR